VEPEAAPWTQALKTVGFASHFLWLLMLFTGRVFIPFLDQFHRYLEEAAQEICFCSCHNRILPERKTDTVAGMFLRRSGQKCMGALTCFAPGGEATGTLVGS
jgi:hypothetical protein